MTHTHNECMMWNYKRNEPCGNKPLTIIRVSGRKAAIVACNAHTLNIARRFDKANLRSELEIERIGK